MKNPPHSHPVLGCEAAKAHEASVLADELAEWKAMRKAGKGAARLMIEDYRELRAVPERLRILALIGKGNNGGDALIACGQLLADYPRARVELILTTPESDLRPLAARALEQLEGRVHAHLVDSESSADALLELWDQLSGGEGFHLCIDGLLGMSFRPPVREPMATVIQAINDYPAIDLRAAIDLPSGRGEDGDEDCFFRADFSYATGIAKTPLFSGEADCGRVRYIDLGFFDGSTPESHESREYILTHRLLDPLRRLRSAVAEKRHFGHLFILGGSAYMPGALLMAVQSAVRSGTGLVTAFAPASVASSLAAQVPEAMWIAWPETRGGTLDPRALSLMMDRVGRASAVLIGPGMGGGRDSELLAQEVVINVEVPVIIDGDALQPRVIEVVPKRRPHFGRVIATPHMGEFMRIAKLSEPNHEAGVLLGFAASSHMTTVLKGPNTQICDGQSIFYNTDGGPVLSRGGSGDLLAGLIGGMVAQDSDDTTTSVARGVMLHGLAAQMLARDQGQVAVRTTQLLDYLSKVLRD